jgi:acyl-CoA dehydrogenase
MALVLNEEQQMLRDAAKTFLADQAPVSHLRKLRDDSVEQGYSRQLWSEMADMGWPAIIIPEVYGGLEYGYTGLGLVLEESGRTLTPSPLISSALLGASALIMSGNKAACERWLPEVAAGEKLLALAFEETAQHRPMHVHTTATRTGEQYVLQGHKHAVIDGHTADAFIVSARTSVTDESGEGISLFLVSKDSKGLTIETREQLDNHRVASVRLDAVHIDQHQLLGELNQGSELLEQVLDRGRIGIAAELLGIAQEVFERTVQYLKERKQFGVPIGSFQALQHRAAILFGEIELCKSVVLKALQALDDQNTQADEIALLASLAKAKCGAVADLATAEGIQLHGGIGMTDEFEIGFYIKRWRSLNQQLGDDRFHTNRFAQLKGY